MFGHGLIMAFSTLTGFTTSACIMAIFSDELQWLDMLAPFSVFIGSAILLGWVFVAIAYVISTTVTEKSKAAGIALVVWFLFVLVFDLGLLGILVSTEGNVDAKWFPYLLLLNPTDIFRLINITYFADQQLSGLMAVVEHARFSIGSLMGGLLLWFLIPAVVAWVSFSRRAL